MLNGGISSTATDLLTPQRLKGFSFLLKFHDDCAIKRRDD